MAVASSSSSPSPVDETRPADASTGGAVQHVRQVVGRMGGSPDEKALAWLVGGLVGIIVSNMLGQIWLNQWQGTFYDALERRDWPGFVHETLRFLLIAGTLLVLVVGQTWFTEMIKIRLRSWLTKDLLDDWLVPKRAYLLTFAGEAGVNPDQRIHEDARHLAELTADLGASLLQATLLLASFIGVLWLLSANIRFPIAGQMVIIPGYMVWCALAFSLAGSALTYVVGRPMIDDNAARYGREADMRFALVRITESAEGITLYGGEADERRALDSLLTAVMTAMRRLANDLARLTWVTSGYGWLALVVPVLVASPGYFAGSLSLGGLMMVVNSFNQVQSSLRWFVDNFSRIADWSATLRRVEALHEALAALDTPNVPEEHLKCIEDDTDGVSFTDFELQLTDGKARFDTPSLDIAAGERVQIVGEHASGKSTLFLAMAGLWTHGAGTIRRPRRERIMFLSERPYFPLGSLAQAITYPDQPDAYPAGSLEPILAELGLDRYAAQLGDVERWDKRLGLDDQQSLAFARLMLHRPGWVVMDDAMSALGPHQRRRILGILAKVEGLSLISLTRAEDSDPCFQRTMRLARTHGRPTVRSRLQTLAERIFRL